MSNFRTVAQRPRRARVSPALEPLEPLVGRWSLRGRTPGADEDDVHGSLEAKAVLEGQLLFQRSELVFQGQSVESWEVVWHDPAARAFPSHVYTNLSGSPIPYSWEVQDGQIIHSGAGARFVGRFSSDRRKLTGSWRSVDEDVVTPGSTYDVEMVRQGSRRAGRS